MPEANIARVTDDGQDFYGREYWFSYQENDLGFPNIKIRSRTDLPERCLHWLRTVLKYKLPPGQALELGSAHGGFVVMLCWASFDATGLELSPWVVEFARDTFGVPMLLGPVEDQQIEPSSLDTIALMDVLEHLPDPVGSMRHCLELLKPDGILLIQTPSFPEDTSYEQMQAESDHFLEQLKGKEHLYLFSHRSIQEFFHRLGANHLTFEPAIFARYDMFLVVSRAPLSVYLPDEIERALSVTPNGRLVQALLDLEDEKDRIKSRLDESEADCAARLDQIHELTRLLQESEADCAARLDQIHELTRLLQESEADRAARFTQIQELTALAKSTQAELQTAQAENERLNSYPEVKLRRKLSRLLNKRL